MLLASESVEIRDENVSRPHAKRQPMAALSLYPLNRPRGVQRADRDRGDANRPPGKKKSRGTIPHGEVRRATV